MEEKTEINPADYFSPDGPFPAQGFLRSIYYPSVGAAVGVSLACFINAFNRKPVFSGVQQHVLLGALGSVLGVGGDRWMQRRAGHRDAIYYNYIITHPEDFPPIQRKKYSEVMERWVPIR